MVASMLDATNTVRQATLSRIKGSSIGSLSGLGQDYALQIKQNNTQSPTLTPVPGAASAPVGTVGKSCSSHSLPSGSLRFPLRSEHSCL